MRSSSIPFHVRATALCVGLALSCAAQAAQYAVTDLGALAPGLFMHATSINDKGQVAGFAYGGQYVLGTVGFNQGNVGGQAFVTGANGQGLTALTNLAGDTWSQANAINNAGQVAGTSGGRASTNTHAFVTAPSSATAQNLGSLGGVSSNATGINAAGQVVGTSTLAGGATRAYITTGGQGGGAMQAITSMQAPYVTVTGVNNAGKLVGYAGGMFLNESSFIAGPQPDAPTESVKDRANVLNGIYTANAINNLGAVAGSYSEFRMAGGLVPFLRDSNGNVILADMSKAPNYIPNAPRGEGPSAEALGLNASGQMVGKITRNDLGMLGHSFAFITEAQGANLVEVGSLDFTNFTASPGFHFTSATGINDLGSFVANGSNGHTYLITSVPEPSSALLLGCGVLSIAGVHMKRRARKQ